ncbi:MAG: Gfo/Idh/MocA family oxidoreductase [Pirellulales bacterium]
MSDSINGSRRDFLKTTAMAATAMSLGGSARAASTNDKLAHACIGVGGMGGHDLSQLSPHPKIEIVALCDVDRNQLAMAAKKHPNATKYTDWRELFDKEMEKIDSVNVSTPDHMHAAIALPAIRAGKHVYCQKPMCHDVAEVRAMTAAAKQAGVVTQLGTQAASSVGDRRAVQWLRDGVIGKVKHMYLCSNRPGAIETYRLKGPRPSELDEVPAALDWDLWIGTAPERPFARRIYHPALWRAWQDFGTGWSGDIGCHIFSAVWKGLNLSAPTSVVAEVQESWTNDAARRADTWPQSDHITWTFPGSDQTEGDQLIVEWHDGEFFSPPDIRALIERDEYPTESSLVIGTEGVLLAQHGSEPELFPAEKFKDFPRPPLPAQDHYTQFVDSCLNGGPTEANFQASGPMTEAVLLGTVAVRIPDTKLEWDADKMSFPNHAAANALLRRTYRDGWDVEGIV